MLASSAFLFKMKDAPPDNLMPLGGSKVENLYVCRKHYIELNLLTKYVLQHL